MKKILQLLVLLILTVGAQTAVAQIKIGDNPGNIDPNAVLELESTSKGFLLPRMTSAQRLAIPSPAEGMMVYDLTANCTYVYRSTGGAWYSFCSADSLTASNGLTKIGRDVQLGGTLTKSTTVTTNGTNTLTIQGSGTNNPLSITGLQSGAAADSIMTLDAATGVVRKRKLSDLLQSSNIDSLVWKIDGNTLDKLRTFGTKNNYPVPIITNNVERMRITETGEVGIGTTTPTNKLTVSAAANPLKLEGVQGGASTDSVMTIDASGVVRKRTVADVAAAGVAVENGLSKTANTIRLGGALNQATTLTTTATNTLAISGLQGATSADSVVMADATTGVLRRMKLSDVGANSFTANNGLTKTGNNVQLGGTLVQATTVDQANNTMAFTNGNVAIGTTTATERLTVSGGNAIVTNSGTATATVSDGTTSGQVKVTGNKTELSSTGTSGLQFSTGASPAARITVQAAGNVGVATATPTSRFEVAGSVAVPIVNSSIAFALTDAHHTFIGNCATSGFTVDLPDPATCIGRTYIIVKGDATNNVLTFSRNIRLSSTQTMPSVNYNVRLHIQSDGTDWWLIARF